MTLTVITNTFNEGKRVESTCKEFLKAGADEVIVCADGSTDGSCDSLPAGVKVVRNETSVGCGRSKFIATMHATGDVLMWVDAHQSVLSGDLRAMAQKALSNGTVVCPPLGNIFYDEQWNPQRMPASRNFYPNDDCILPDSTAQYRLNPVVGKAVGVGLCMSRDTYLRSGGWNRFLGRHGSQERGMALRLFMAGIPVEIDDTILVGHEFFGTTHPSRNSTTGQYRFNNIAPSIFNAWHSYMTVSSPAVFEKWFKPWLLACPNGASGQKAVDNLDAQQDRDYFLRHCKHRTDSELLEFTEGLLEKRKPTKDPGTASLEPDAVRILNSMARGRCLELGSGSGLGTTAILKGALSVVSVDHMPKYTALAASKVPDSRVEFVTCPLSPATGFYDLSSLKGIFDFVLIDGPPGRMARRNALRQVAPLLAVGAVVIEDDAKRDMVNIAPLAKELGFSMKLLPTNRGLAVLKKD